MKHIREMAKASRASKLARFCGGGDVARVKKGMPSRDGEPKGYAHGGMVGGGMAEGMPSKPRLDRGGRMKKPGKAAKAGTHVNVVVMPHGGGAPPPSPDMGAMPPMPPGGAGPMPPMPPMGGGMPGQKHGGKVGRYAKGGKVKKMADGGDADDNPVAGYMKKKGDESSTDATMDAIKSGIYGGAGAAMAHTPPAAAVLLGAGAVHLGKSIVEGAKATQMKRGEKMWNDTGMKGRPSKDDAEGRKHGGKVEKREHKSLGGPAKPARGYDAGAGGAKGRLEKAKKYGAK